MLKKLAALLMAAAMLLSMTAAGAENVTVCCRTPKKAEELAARSPRIRLCGLAETACEEALQQAGLFINCTPLGMQGVQAQFDDFSFLDRLPASTPVCDLIYRPLKTRLLEEAEKRGHPAANGLGMLIHQAILALEQFASLSLDADLMKKAVMKRLLPVLNRGQLPPESRKVPG